jgi:hypothetical protein
MDYEIVRSVKAALTAGKVAKKGSRKVSPRDV